MTNFSAQNDFLMKEIIVWRIAIKSDLPLSALKVLSPAEQQYAQSINHPAVRRQYLSGRVALRQILGSCLGRPPESLSFSYGRHKKPFLTTQPGMLPLEFSLAHTGNLVLIAVSRAGLVGVDVEAYARVLRNPVKLARKVLSEREQQELRQSEGLSVIDYWVAKEACLKALGTGLAVPPGSVEVEFSGRRGVGVVGGRRWYLELFEPAEGVVGAVAVESEEVKLQVREWGW